MNSRENLNSQKNEKGLARSALATGQALSDADKMTQQQKDNTMKPEITYTLEIMPEEMDIRGNASAWNDEEDEAYAKEIEKRLYAGDLWAWCCVKVTATCEGFTGTDYLGGCSYKDEADFCADGGYFQDMKDQARQDLRVNLAHAAERGNRAAKLLKAIN